MDILEPVTLSPDDADANARIRDAAPDLLRALQAQQSAEDAHCNCPECDEGEREWWTCERCSERYGFAIDLRHRALVTAGAMRIVPAPDAPTPNPDKKGAPSGS